MLFVLTGSALLFASTAARGGGGTALRIATMLRGPPPAETLTMPLAVVYTWSRLSSPSKSLTHRTISCAAPTPSSRWASHDHDSGHLDSCTLDSLVTFRF